jgi:hypothetical protein
MSILTDARQYPLVAVVDIVQADLPTGVEVDVLELPQNSVVTRIDFTVDVAFDSTTSDTIDIGDTTLTTRYSTDIDAAASAGAIEAGVPTGFQTTDAEPNITLINTAVGATEGTAGVARLIVEYYVAGRQNENQGGD